MKTAFSLAGSALALTATMLVATYVVAVLDIVFARLTARTPVRLLATATLPLRQAAQLALQTRTVTERPDAGTWALAPALLAALAAVGLAVVPLTGALVASSADTGIVVFAAAMALVIVAVYLQGWSPNSPLPLIAAYRFIAEGLSYEIPFAVVLIGAAIPARSLALAPIVTSQEHLWNVVRQPLGLPVYLVTALALAFWGPLALPEGEDVAGGTAMETSGVPRLLWRAAQLQVLVAVSAMGAAVFLGGWLGPWLPGGVWMALKTLFLAALLVATRQVLARVRTESFVVVAWVVLIPLSLLDVFIAGIQAMVAAR
jgi:NADH-quinone oxidoreductase subunit H